MRRWNSRELNNLFFASFVVAQFRSGSQGREDQERKGGVRQREEGESA